MIESQLVGLFTQILDDLARPHAEKYDYEMAHKRAHQQIERIPKDIPLLGAIDKAIGGSKRRKREAVELMIDMAERSEVRERLLSVYETLTDDEKANFFTAIARSKVTECADFANAAIGRETDYWLRNSIIQCMATLATDSNVSTLLDLSRADLSRPSCEPPWDRSALMYAILTYPDRRFVPYLGAVFTLRGDPDFPYASADRVMAAHALHKIDPPRVDAIRYLVEMLEDSDIPRKSGSPIYGVSRDAAIALCAIFGLDFKKLRDSCNSHEKVLQRVKDLAREKGFLV